MYSFYLFNIEIPREKINFYLEKINVKKHNRKVRKNHYNVLFAGYMPSFPLMKI